jgi:hypothetical protein
MSIAEPTAALSAAELREVGLTAPLTAEATAANGLSLPNQFHLAGAGTSVSYFPDGSGPIVEPNGSVSLVYQDAYHAQEFRQHQVRVAQVADLGTLVSVTLSLTLDMGSTTFTLIVPDVAVETGLAGGSPVSTYGITTVHRIFAARIGHPQSETYTVTPLTGIASAGILPL